MSTFVNVVAGDLAVASVDLTSTGSEIRKAHTAAAGATTEIQPAGQDEVSEAIAALFSGYGEEYQTLSKLAIRFHDQFIQRLAAGEGAYTDAEAANASSLRTAEDIGVRSGVDDAGIVRTGGADDSIRILLMHSPTDSDESEKDFRPVEWRDGPPGDLKEIDYIIINGGENSVDAGQRTAPGVRGLLDGGGNEGSSTAGSFNFGSGNTGNLNLGDQNTAGFNAGNGNNSAYNVGGGNRGWSNIGFVNFGDHNLGWGNVGSSNIGFANSGSHNWGIGLTGDNKLGIGWLSASVQNLELFTWTDLFNWSIGFRSGDPLGIGWLGMGVPNLELFYVENGNWGFGSIGNNNIGFFNAGVGNMGVFNYGHGNWGFSNSGHQNTGFANGALWG